MMHPRVSLSAISTYSWSLEEDLRFYAAAGVTNIGVSVVKLEQAGWDVGTRQVVDSGVQVSNLIGLGPFHLAAPDQWNRQRDRLHHALDAAQAVDAGCLIFTTGPAGALSWEDAADALDVALAPVVRDAVHRGVPFALEHTNSLRVDVGFVHTLRDVIDLARRLGTGVCMEINACWAERALRSTIADGIDVLQLVQVSDFAVGTLSTPNRLVPGDGDIPIERILSWVLDAGYEGCFDLELIGPRIDEEGYDAACRRSIETLGSMLEGLGARR